MKTEGQVRIPSGCAISAVISKEGKVCDIVNGKPKVKRIEREDCIEFVRKYSLFHKEIKRYDKRTFEQLQ